jgi:hypothetical protein
MLLSSGFLANSTNRSPYPLPQTTILNLDNTNSGMLILNIQSMVNAHAFEVQMKNGSGAFAPAGIYAYARRILLPNLTPGQSYTVQARAIGGSTGCGGWSDPVSRIVT